MKELTGYPSIDKIHLKDTKFLERNPIIPGFLTFSQLMDLMFLKQGKHECFDSMELRVNTDEFQKDALTFAKAFLELGIKPGDIVSVATPNYYQAVVVFKATNMIGAITTYLNPYAKEDEIKKYLNMYESKVFIDFDKEKEYNDDISKNTKAKYIFTLSENDVNSRDFYTPINYIVGNKDIMSLNEIGNVSKFQSDRFKTNFGGKQDALILYTSGSTGKPKSLLFTNENLASSCIYLKNSTHVPNVTENDKKWMGVVPFMYPYGFGASVLSTLLAGREAVLAPNINASNLAYFCSKNANLWFGSPAFLDVVENNLPKEQELQSLHHFVSGGDYLSVNKSLDAIKFFEEHGADVLIENGSGTGETLACSTNAMNVPYRPETVGKLVVGPDYVVLNENNEECKYGEKGVLCTRGKHVFKGYYNNDELTAETRIMYNGKEYYKTGNYGYLDESGYFTLTGRSSRFYIASNFNKVYCELVQNVIANVDVVDSAAVVPKPNKKMRYVSKAYVVLKEELKEKITSGDISAEDVKNYIIEKSKEKIVDNTTGEITILKDYEVPESITFVEKLPRTESAEKIDYEKMKNWAEEEYENEIKEETNNCEKEIVKK